MQKWLNVKILLINVLILLFTTASWALPDYAVTVDKTKLIHDQTDLLKNRLAQAQNQFTLLTNQSASALPLVVNAALQNQAALDVSVAGSNVDSISIELAESDQALSRFDKDIQEIENQLNVFSVFGVKIASTEKLNIEGLRADLNYQKSLLELEKTREQYLKELQKLADASLQLQKERLLRINNLLKEQAINQLKQRQEQSEAGFQQQQSFWLQKLNNFYTRLNQLGTTKAKDKNTYTDLQREIFLRQ